MIKECLMVLVICMSFACIGLPVSRISNIAESPSPLPRIREKNTMEMESDVIVPGVGIQLLQIGDTPEEAIQKLGSPSEDYSYPFETPCMNREMHWFINGWSDGGMFAYFRDGRVFQIEVISPRFKVKGGFQLGEKASEIAHELNGTFSLYRLTGSAGKINGFKDIKYLVNRTEGVAYEFAYFPSDRHYHVSSILVFAPSSDLVPEGCMPNWRTLKPQKLSDADKSE